MKTLSDFITKKSSVGVVGLGYVGLPLACTLAKKFNIIGFDINLQRVDELKSGIDRTNEVEDAQLLKQKSLVFTAEKKDLSDCDIIIVAVPTPIDDFKKPDLTPLISASNTVGSIMKKGCIVVYESTVYPGLTENECRVTLEKASGLTYLKDFYLGYSPERVNPGDREHTIERVIKVVSGCNDQVASLLCEIYGAVVQAGVHRAPSIAAAEAAKVIENTQRDINIALVNELSQIFDRIGLDTQDVLAAARTKWNFLDFRPGLVGGHCIGVDPYYLTHMSEGVGYHADIISAARMVNDSMGEFVAEKTIRLILKHRKPSIEKIKIAILGVTFKENVPDLRNTKVVDVIKTLEDYQAEVFAFDPVAEEYEFRKEYGKTLTSWDSLPKVDAVIVAVKHRDFINKYGLNKIVEKLNDTKVFIDIKASFDKSECQRMQLNYWRL